MKSKCRVKLDRLVVGNFCIGFFFVTCQFKVACVVAGGTLEEDIGAHFLAAWSKKDDVAVSKMCLVDFRITCLGDLLDESLDGLHL